MRLERNELQALVAVIEAGGFGKGAEFLGLSQSAVSQTVAGLENKLGTQLVKRARTPALTRPGQRVYDHALQSLSSEQLVLQDVAALRRGIRPPLSLAMNTFVRQYLAGDLLAASARDDAELVINLRVMPAREIIGAVLAGQAELGFGPFQTHMQAFDTVALMNVRHSLVISPRHPDCAAICAGDQQRLASSRLIVSYLDEPEQRPGQQRIRDFFTTIWQINSLPLRLEMIRAGLGVGFINVPMLRDQAGGEQLQEIGRSGFASFEREVGLYYQRGARLSDVAERFVELCRTHVTLPADD